MLQNADNCDDALIDSLSARLRHRVEDIERAYHSAPRNVRTVLTRQYVNTVHPDPKRPVCDFVGEQQLLKTLGGLSATVAVFTLARIYDKAHIALCRTTASRKSAFLYDVLVRKLRVDLRLLADQARFIEQATEQEVVLDVSPSDDMLLVATWQQIPPMTFDNLPQLVSLADILPGERTGSHEYAGIGGGGGSDIISASLIGHLLLGHDKKMDLLISTRTWATGSQGKKGSKLGIKREVYNHGGAAETHGRPVAGTFRVEKRTTAEGRDLEAIPLPYHSQIFMVLDQGESKAQISQNDQADLTDQLGAVLSQAKRQIESVIIVDTGGDVFGTDGSGSTTPDQDYRVQKAMSPLESSYNLVTAVVAPGVDAPNDAPEKALGAGGMVYKPTEDEKQTLLDLLANKYKMDGSDPTRFGKTTLALQARLRGVTGWTSLDLPNHVVDTWENPWNSFVYIRECMSDIILMPTVKLLPLIEPIKPRV
jgi:hypothetical protein